MTELPPRVIRLHPSDNVAVALEDVAPGRPLPEFGIVAKTEVKRGHKIALRPIAKGAAVHRYGQIIGSATEDIGPGAHVHSPQPRHGRPQPDYAFGADCRPLPPRPGARSFMGYHRADGRFGTRNYLGILTSVNCSGSVARFIAEAAEKAAVVRASSPTSTASCPIVHGTGCGMSGEDEGYDTLFRTIAGYARNPNFGGILLVGLGCEVMQIPDLIGKARMRADGNFRYMTIQQTGGTRRTIERGLGAARNGRGREPATPRAAPAPTSRSALQCGGSDGYSGITANPALGHASDLLVRHGGTTILSRRPRSTAPSTCSPAAPSPEVGQKPVERIRWWEDYTAKNGGEMDNNPSPGNKRGGLTTILEKSLGAVAKGGTAPLAGVYKFAEPITERASSSWTAPATTPARSPARSPRARTSSPSPPGAARSRATSPRPASSSPPTPRCTPACPRTWTSTAATSSPMASVEAKGRRSLSCSCASPRASRRNRRSSASAARNSCRGRSAR
jgi:altronate dehydratase